MSNYYYILLLLAIILLYYIIIIIIIYLLLFDERKHEWTRARQASSAYCARSGNAKLYFRRAETTHA